MVKKINSVRVKVKGKLKSLVFQITHRGQRVITNIIIIVKKRIVIISFSLIVSRSSAVGAVSPLSTKPQIEPTKPQIELVIEKPSFLVVAPPAQEPKIKFASSEDKANELNQDLELDSLIKKNKSIREESSKNLEHVESKLAKEETEEKEEEKEESFIKKTIKETIKETFKSTVKQMAGKITFKNLKELPQNIRDWWRENLVTPNLSTTEQELEKSLKKSRADSGQTFEADEFFNHPAEYEKSGEIKKRRVLAIISDDSTLQTEANKILMKPENRRSFSKIIYKHRMGTTDSENDIKPVPGTHLSKMRGENGTRIYFREKNERIEVVAISDKENQNTVISILKKHYPPE